MMPRKGASTQCHNQQVLAKPHHQPSNRDQQAREKLQQKVKIKSRAYIQLGEEALQIIHRTFQPDTPVILHLPAFSRQLIRLKSKFTSHIVRNTRRSKLFANHGLLFHQC